MKILSLDNAPMPAKKDTLFYIVLAVVSALVLVLLLNGSILLISWVLTFIKNYWPFIIIGLIVLIFLRRWFRKKELVVKREAYDYD